jgi:hypothetical protein
MGQAHSPEPVKLIAGLLAASPTLLEAGRDLLGSEFGGVEQATEPYAWTESSYYCAEMGRDIWRQFVSLGLLFDPASLPDVKHRTNELEARWRDQRGRRVNLDPGYVDVNKLVLASTKDAAHRVYVRDGIYAEVTLRFEAGAWQPHDATYRDYAEPVAAMFFRQVRDRLLVQRRGSRNQREGRTSAAGRRASPG